jgi:hypothetical protein
MRVYVCQELAKHRALCTNVAQKELYANKNWPELKFEKRHGWNMMCHNWLFACGFPISFKQCTGK